MLSVYVLWFEFWRKKKAAFLALLLLLVAVAVFAFSKLKIHEDIREILPNDTQTQDWNAFMQEAGLMRSIIFAVAVNPESSYEEMDSLSREFTALLEQDSAWIKKINARANVDMQQGFHYMMERLPLLMDEKDYAELAKRIEPDSIRKTMTGNYARLQTIEGVGLKTIIAADPLLLTRLAREQLEEFAQMRPFEVNEDLLLSKSGDALVITAKAGEEYSMSDKQRQASDRLALISQQWNEAHPDNKVRYFAGFLVSAENSRQVQTDTKITLSLAAGCILIVLLFFFRNITTPIWFLLPSGFGVLFAVIVTAFFKGDISGIAVGISAVVLGITMDYSFHFFTHLHDTRSIRETLRDIAMPLLTGCFTTVMAFGALLFTNSKLLQDFGFFALFSLAGTMAAVLFILPVLLDIFNYKMPPPSVPADAEHAGSGKEFRISGKVKALLFFAVLGFTGWMLQQAMQIGFDGNPDNLVYYPEELKDDERYFQQLEPKKEKRLFLLAAENSDSAQYRSYRLLDSLQQSGEIKSFMSAGWFHMPAAVREQSFERWSRFWDAHRDSFLAQFDREAAAAGFSPAAFGSFKRMIAPGYRPESGEATPEWLSALPVVPGKGVVHSFIVDVNKKDHVLDILSHENLVRTLDPGSISKALLDVVREDFNFILLASSIIVFVTLLLVYGRMELAFITFFPMALSWIWIVGVSATLGLKFNFANIILTTFIFGLGDDYAIFVSDAYLNKYRFGKNLLPVYRKGILLSAATTIIGTGVLVFAKHPALNSIASISIVGLITILLISFTVQPYLFDMLIFNRTEKKRSPYTLKGFLLSLFAFSYFLFGCLLAYLIHLLLRIFPAPVKQKKYWFHHVLRFFCGSLIYVMMNVKKRIYGKENFDFSKPSVMIANHSSFLDILALLMLHPKIVMLTNKWVYFSPFFGASIRYADFVYAAEGYENNLDQFRKLVADGYTILIYPEGTRSPDGKIKRFHKGAFYLAEQLQLDITPVLLHGFHFTMSKHDFLLKDGYLNIKALPRIKPDDKSFGENYSERTKAISRYFRQQHEIFRDERETPAYIYPRMLLNYIYKHPQVEWYFRIKWRSARSLYQLYDSLVPKQATVYDLGCGYGFLAYYLAFRSEYRKIYGIDYDDEKISIAQNNFEKTENLDFKDADIRKVALENADVIFLNDVLHYLPEQDQLPLLEKCVAALNPGGKIYLRDGDAGEEKAKHNMTRLSEWLSTNISFNRTDGKLHFFSRNFITGFCEANGLQCEILNESKNTSNILFAISKAG